MTLYTDTFEHAGLHVRIYMEDYIDENDNPRTNQDGNMGVMFCDYRGYRLGDADAPDPRDNALRCEACNGSGEDPNGKHAIWGRRGYGSACVKSEFLDLASAERYMERHAPAGSRWYVEPQSCSACEGEGQIEVGIVEYLKREHGARVVLPLMVYEHSGITMRVGRGWRSTNQFPGDEAGWDTSLVGVIFDTKETHEARGDTDLTDEQIEEVLTSEVSYYAAFLEGQVYGYDVVRCEPDEDGDVDPESDDCEVLGGCGGFLCATTEDREYMLSEARGEAEYCAQAIERERAEAFRWACADVVTV